MEFRILGPLEALEGSDTIRLGGPQQRAVLAHLVIRSNQLVTTERLIDLVWGDDPPAAVRKSLQSHVSHLRTSVGADRLESRPGGYVLHAEPDEIDAVRFEALVQEARTRGADDGAIGVYGQALDLWRGDALDGLGGQESLLPEIVRLEELRLSAIEERIALELESGKPAELVAQLETLVTLYPLRERLWAHLMLALYRSGRQADALDRYRRLRHLLADQLGIDPSAPLQTLEQHILDQDESLDRATPTLRGYRLIEEIGRGSIGTVHRAIHPDLARQVALKVVDSAVSNEPEYIRRFAAETEAIARLDHPHVVPLYDAWRDAEGAYLVMRHMTGGTLRARLAAGPLDDERIPAILEQVASATSAAHRQGIVHCDIRPENILFDADGNAHLSDFAISGDVRARPPDGHRNDYRAPESIRDGEVTVAGDVYSLGVVAFEMLTGRHPFAGVADADLEGDRVSPSLGSHRPEFAGTLDGILARATSTDPDARGDPTTLAADIRRALTGHAGPRSDGTHDLRNPYKGLQAFHEADADDLFGRDDLIDDIVSGIGDPPDRFLALVGPSGSGKSSVIRAGVVPALRRGAAQGSERWFIVDMVPGAYPFSSLETALRRVAVDALPGLGELLERDERGIVEAAREVLGTQAELLIVIDQFEEMFVLAHESAIRPFLAALVTAATDPSSGVRVIVTLRADFYDRPLQYAAFGELLASRTLAVAPLSAADLARAVVGPAEAVGMTVESDLVAAIVTDVTNQPGALPLLQYALTELFAERRGRTLTLDDYDRIGRVAGALARRAESIFHGLDANGQEAARQLFTRLVSPGDGTGDTRRRAHRAEIMSAAVDQSAMDGAIEAFARHRLVSLDRDPTSRSPTVEVAHESLLVEWPRLKGWIDDRRQDIRLHRRLTEATQEWMAAGRDIRLLARSGHLAQYQAWAEATDLALTEDERAFYEAGVAQQTTEREEEEAQRRRESVLEQRAASRRRTLVVVSLIAAIVAGALAVVATDQRNEATRQALVATARGLSAAANANLESDAELSLLLALEAVESTRTPYAFVLPEAEEALHRSVAASRNVKTLDTAGGALDWSPDGQTFVTEGPEESGLVDIRRADTGESVIEPWVGHEIDVNDVAYSTDGSRLATTGDDGKLAVWDTRTGDQVAAVTGSGEVWGPSFDSAGRRVAAAWRTEGAIRVLDVTSGQVEATFDGLHFVTDTSLSPDGTRVAVSGDDVPVFDVASGERLFSLGSLDQVFWSPDGRWIATTEGGNVRVFDADSGDRRMSFYVDTSFVVGLDWSLDSTRLVTTSDFSDVATVWQLTDEGARETLTVSPASGWVAFSSDGNRIMTNGADTTTVKIWDVSPTGGTEWATFEVGHEDLVGADFTPDGHVVTGDRGLSITRWDPQTRERVFDFDQVPAFPNRPFVVDVSPDGELMAAATERTTTVWNARSGDMVYQVGGSFAYAYVSDLDWSADGRLAIVTDDGRTRVVDRDGREVTVFREENDTDVVAASFSPNGELLAFVLQPRLRQNNAAASVAIRDSTSGELVRTLQTLAFHLDFDPTGTRLATGANGVDIWDVATGEKLSHLPVTSGDVWTVAYHPDGTLLAATSTDGIIRLWDTESGAQRLALRGHSGEVFTLEFSDDGSKLVSTGVDGTARVWAIDLEDLMDMGRNRVTRTLTDDECQRYLSRSTCPSPEA